MAHGLFPQGKERPYAQAWTVGGLLLLVLGLLNCVSLDRGGPGSKAVVALLFLAFGALAVFLLTRAQLSQSAFLMCLLPLGLAIFLRVLSMDYATGDYNDFLAPWTEFFRNNGGFLAIKEEVGNYNAPYLYFLAGISYLPIPDLYLIKLLSIFFDLLLAWSGLRLVRRLRPGQDHLAAGTFSLLLLLPTVILNGALWGQCDGVYAALVLFGLADALDGRPIRSVVWLGIAFSFKLQAIFLIPLWCILWYSKRVKFWHLLIFPVSYFATILPAWLLGKPLGDILGVYLYQTGQYNDYLTLNAPSVFSLIPYGMQVDTALWARIGVVAAFALVALLLVWLLFFRHSLTDQHIVTAGLILAIGVPLLLPHMHERYFYLAEALSLIWAMGSPRRAAVPAAVQVSTLSGYHAYLVLRYLYPMAWGAWLLLAALLTVIIALVLDQWKAGHFSSDPPSHPTDTLPHSSL